MFYLKSLSQSAPEYQLLEIVSGESAVVLSSLLVGMWLATVRSVELVGPLAQSSRAFLIILYCVKAFPEIRLRCLGSLGPGLHLCLAVGEKKVEVNKNNGCEMQKGIVHIYSHFFLFKSFSCCRLLVMLPFCG